MRKPILIGILTLTAILGSLTAIEVFRTKAMIELPPPLAGPLHDATSDATLSTPEGYHVFLARLKQRYVAMDDRYRSLEHTETIQAFDRSGDMDKPVRRTVERVWYSGTKEHRQAVAAEETNPSDFRPPVAKQRDDSLIYPFTRGAEPNAYRYVFEGEEPLDGKPTVRVRFEPEGSEEKKLRGVVWADLKSAEPIRFDGIVCRPRMFVDSIRYITEYGPSENGKRQIRLIRIEGTGGFALVRRQFRVDVAMSDYRIRPNSNSADNR